MKNISVALGKKIRDLRISRGLSQEKLALQADIDRTYITGIENGRRNISVFYLHKICNALNTSLSELTKGI